VVVPRPIAWVSTLSPDGVRNLAPFSYFAPVTSLPPLVTISVGRRRRQRKDTSTNASLTGELVINFVSEAQLDRMVQTSADYPPEVDEFERAGVAAVDSVLVKPPRVAEALIQMECRTREIFEISPGIADLVVAEIVMFHLADELPVSDDLHIPADTLRPVARLGAEEYAFLGAIHERSRPKP
jgi:flavin reductase (DIM6/NTAB) family NADH-FMN oxidoreductase RutF